MHLTWTADQILGLAPDQYIYKAGQSLADANKWLRLGRDAQAIWGEVAVTNRRPIQAAVALPHLTLRCSCSARRFPCRHVVALLMLLTRGSAAPTRDDAPPWVVQWRTRRERLAKAGAPAPPDARAVARRQAAVVAGLAELERWLEDMVRGGLALLPDRGRDYWTAMADRLVDAQAGDVAHRVRGLATVAGKQPDWPDQILREVGHLYLLIQGFKRFDSLAPDAQADLRTAVGWPPRQHAGVTLPGRRDQWLVLGRRHEARGRRHVHRTWLWGVRSGRPALLTQPLYRGRSQLDALVTGAVLDGTLYFYSGRRPLAAWIGAYEVVAPPVAPPPGDASLLATLRDVAEGLAENPWRRLWPLALQRLNAQRDGKGWVVVDDAGMRLPLPEKFRYGWHFMAVGGATLTLFGEWDGATFTPLSLYRDGRWQDFHLWQGVR